MNTFILLMLLVILIYVGFWSQHILTKVNRLQRQILNLGWTIAQIPVTPEEQVEIEKAVEPGSMTRVDDVCRHMWRSCPPHHMKCMECGEVKQA